MPPERADVARQLESTRQGQDFSGVTTELQRLQRESPQTFTENLARINRQVDMRGLGFPDNVDFNITGVTSEGRILTRNPDGRQVVRDGRTFEPTAAREPSPRQFQRQQDGSEKYTVRQGDTLWDISRERMRAQHGRTPTPQEIQNDYREIARANGIQDPNRIRPGQEIRLPRPGERPAEAPARPGARPAGSPEQVPPLRTEAVQRQAAELPRGVSHPLIVPGLNTEPGAARQEGIRRTGSGRDNTTSGLPTERELPGRVDSPPAQDGTRRQQYQVEVGGNGTPPTNVERVLDQQGNVIRSSVRYPEGVGPSMRVQLPEGVQAGGRSGDVHIADPRSVETERGRDGNYTTVVVEEGGRRHTFRTDGRTGRVTAYEAR